MTYRQLRGHRPTELRVIYVGKKDWFNQLHVCHCMNIYENNKEVVINGGIAPCSLKKRVGHKFNLGISTKVIDTFAEISY